MLFNSVVFLFAFLPITLLVFHLLGRSRRIGAARIWLVAASLFFYAWWNPRYLPLLVASVAVNYGLGVWLATTPATPRRRKLGLALGVALNLSTLGVFKYAHFAAENLSGLIGGDFPLPPIVLPLAISFYTFQQIAFLVDEWRHPGRPPGWLDYTLFVTFFPQLIAGPIVHHRETIPQFARDTLYTLRRPDLEVGITIFAIGLFKKVVLADGVAIHASRVFEQVSLGASPDLFAGWSAALAYTFQLYFDFSGYSDMAIGLGRMFGVRLPLNFDSPYKATSIIEFWRRWHMTLSRFLRDYLYFPLGGNRRGRGRRYVNLMTTMLLGGLWHGAGWNFAFWGGLHGIYLVVNHLWRATGIRLPTGRFGPWLGRGVTFFFVVLAWVPFRAETTSGTLSIWRGLLGLEGIGFDSTFSDSETVPLLLAALAAMWLLPNSQTLIGLSDPAPARPGLDLRWSTHPGWAIAVIALFVAVVLSLSRPSEFIYYQF